MDSWYNYPELIFWTAKAHVVPSVVNVHAASRPLAVRTSSTRPRGRSPFRWPRGHSLSLSLFAVPVASRPLSLSLYTLHTWWPRGHTLSFCTLCVLSSPGEPKSGHTCLAGRRKRYILRTVARSLRGDHPSASCTLLAPAIQPRSLSGMFYVSTARLASYPCRRC